MIAQLVERVLFFQPLNRLARQRLQETSEYLCDDWSVDQTRRPLVLARCLTEVAGWLVTPAPNATVPGMLQTGSELSRRVCRLLAPQERNLPMSQSRRLLPIGAAILFGVAALAPRFAVRPAEAAPGPGADTAAIPAPTPAPASIHPTPTNPSTSRCTRAAPGPGTGPARPRPTR